MVYRVYILIFLLFQVINGAPVDSAHVEVNLTGEEMIAAGKLVWEKMPEIKDGIKSELKHKVKKTVNMVPGVGAAVKVSKKIIPKQKEKSEISTKKAETPKSVPEPIEIIDKTNFAQERVKTVDDGVVGYRTARFSKGMAIPKRK